MENILLVINIILAVLLVGVVLMQKSEGGALGIGVSQERLTKYGHLKHNGKFEGKILQKHLMPCYQKMFLKREKFYLSRRGRQPSERRLV